MPREGYEFVGPLTFDDNSRNLFPGLNSKIKMVFFNLKKYFQRVF